jgi:hypothetical protein
LKAVAKAAGFDLVKQGKGWRLVDAVSGTIVADDWAGDDGLTLAEIETALKS